MAGRADPVVGPLGDAGGEGLDGQVVAVEEFIDVQVGADTARFGEVEQSRELGDGVIGDVRGPADEVDAGVERGLDVRGGREWARQDRDLDVHQSAQVLPDLGEHADGSQWVVVREHVGVGAHRGDAVAQHGRGRPEGARPEGLLIEGDAAGPPGGDRGVEVAARR